MIGWKRRRTITTTADQSRPPLVMRVPSCVVGADFVVTAVPVCTPGPDAAGRDGDWGRCAELIAADCIREVVERIAAHRLVAHCAATEIAINRALLVPTRVQHPIDVLVTGQVRVAPAKDSVEPTRLYLEARRPENVRLGALRESLGLHLNVMQDPEKAWAWWLLQDPRKVGEVRAELFAQTLDTLDQVRFDKTVWAGDRDSFAKVIADFIAKTDPAHAQLAVGLLRRFLEFYDEQSLLERVDVLDPLHESG